MLFNEGDGNKSYKSGKWIAMLRSHFNNLSGSSKFRNWDFSSLFSEDDFLKESELWLSTMAVIILLMIIDYFWKNYCMGVSEVTIKWKYFLNGISWK